MNIDKAFEQLRTLVFDLCNDGSNSCCKSVFNEFKAKYTTFKQLFFLLQEKNIWETKGRKQKVT